MRNVSVRTGGMLVFFLAAALLAACGGRSAAVPVMEGAAPGTAGGLSAIAPAAQSAAQPPAELKASSSQAALPQPAHPQAAYMPRATPTPIECGSGGLTDCFIVPSFDEVELAVSGTDLFCPGGNPQGTWSASPAPRAVTIAFVPLVTSTCGQTVLREVSRYNAQTATVVADESLAVGTVSGDPAEVAFKVPGRACLCYANEIYNAATYWKVDPFLIAAVAAQERCDGNGCTPVAPSPLCGTNAVGEDPTGFGVLQIDAGTFGRFDFRYGTNTWADIDYGTELIAYWEKVYGSEAAALAHFHGAGTVADQDNPAGPPITYAADVDRIRDDIKAAGLGFACVTNPSAVAWLSPDGIASTVATGFAPFRDNAKCG